MTLPEEPLIIESPTLEEKTPSSSESNSMEDYYQLKNTLLLVTLAFTAVVFLCVWYYYSLNTAISYLLGSCVGLVYLRMLAKDVEKLGGEKKGLGSSRLALFVGLMIVATQWEQLQVLPVILGFMTYKAAIIFYVLQTTLTPAPKKK